MGEFQQHEPCGSCGSSDALARYEDGGAYCFACGHHQRGAGEPTSAPAPASSSKKGKKMIPFADIEIKRLAKRFITEDTCQHFKYGVAKHGNKTVQVAPFYRDGKLVAQKCRTAGKDFYVLGETKKLPLFGQDQCREGGKRIVVTEGEIDAMTVSQLQGNKWPVVSVPQGAPSAAKFVGQEIEFLETFETVVFMFDMDEPGVEAAKECAALLTPGKAAIAQLPRKDANAMLQAGNGKGVIDAMWGAKPYRPDGLLSIDDVIEEAEKPVEWGKPWCFDTLTKATYGRRPGEVYGFGAGTGIGKTDLFTQQIEFDVSTLGEHVGVIYLEQGCVETAKRIAGKKAGRRFHVPDAGWTAEELRESLQSLRGKVTMYDNFGSTEWDVVSAKIRYMVRGLGIQMIYLDHLTAMAESGSDERGSIEDIMKEMAMLAKELGCTIHYVSHLATPEGKPHEEGGRVTIRHFKGSRAIGFWSYYMFGLERDQQNEDKEIAHTTVFRCLKDRYTGQATGLTFGLGYDEETGRLYERPLPEKKPKSGEDYGFNDEY